MIQIKILSGKSANQFFLVRRFPFSVGRKSDSGLKSEEAGVWGEHFQIDYRSADGIFLIPNAGASTSINSEVINEPTRLENGAEISAGALRLRFNLADAEVRSYRYRELATWAAVGCIVAVQIWLLVTLPK